MPNIYFLLHLIPNDIHTPPYNVVDDVSRRQNQKCTKPTFFARFFDTINVSIVNTFCPTLLPCKSFQDTIVCFYLISIFSTHTRDYNKQLSVRLESKRWTCLNFGPSRLCDIQSTYK